MAKRPTTIINVEPTRTGLRGRIDRLCFEYAQKAQALRITGEILDEHDRRDALEAAPRKFLQAVNHRNGQAGRPRLTRTPKTKKPKPQRRGGESSSLLILEQLADDDKRPLADVIAAAAQAGAVVHGRAIGGLVRFGYAKGNKATGYRRTPKGATYATALRSQLNAAAVGGGLT